MEEDRKRAQQLKEMAANASAVTDHKLS